jgi:hypothetical protein
MLIMLFYLNSNLLCKTVMYSTASVLFHEVMHVRNIVADRQMDTTVGNTGKELECTGTVCYCRVGKI